MTSDFNIADRVKSVVASYFRVAPESVHAQTTLEGLGADYLDRIQLAIDVETAFDIDICLDKAPSFRTIGDLVAEVEGVAGVAA